MDSNSSEKIDCSESREIDSLRQPSSKRNDNEINTVLHDWSCVDDDITAPVSVAEAIIDAEDRISHCKWKMEHKLSSDSGVACVSHSGEGSADDLFKVQPSHSNNSLSDWKKSFDSLSAANKSTDSISLYSCSNINNKSTDNSLSLVKSVDSLSVNKSLDSLNINDSTNSRYSLGSASYEWSNDGASENNSFDDSQPYSQYSDTKYLKTEMRLIEKSLSNQKSKLREWKSRTNVSCDIDWKDYKEDEETNISSQDQINLSCDMLDRLSLNHDSQQYGAGASRSTESIHNHRKDLINNYPHPQSKNLRETVGFFSFCDRAVSVHQEVSTGAAVTENLGQYSSTALSHETLHNSSPHTPVTPKSSQHSLFSNSTPNSLSMTPNSSSLASDSLLEMPDSLCNPSINNYNSQAITPNNSLSNNCDVYNGLQKSLPRTPLSYSHTANSSHNTSLHNSSYSNIPESYPSHDNQYSGTPISYNNTNNSYLNSFYHTPDAYLEAPSGSFSRCPFNPYDGDPYPGAAHATSNAQSDQQYASSQLTAQAAAGKFICIFIFPQSMQRIFLPKFRLEQLMVNLFSYD